MGINEGHKYNPIYGILYGIVGLWVMIKFVSIVFSEKYDFFGPEGDALLALLVGSFLGLFVVNILNKNNQSTSTQTMEKGRKSTPEQLLQLKLLLDSGSLTQEEYVEMKKKILDADNVKTSSTVATKQTNVESSSDSSEEKKDNSINDALGL